METTRAPTISVDDIADKAARLAHSLRKLLKIKCPNDREVEVLQQELRRNYESLIFTDYKWAESRNVETDLWLRGHHEIIQAYRKQLANLESSNLGGGAKPVVELRKVGEAFNRFLQEATTFYKSLLKQLVVNFGLLEDLRPLFDKFELNGIASAHAETILAKDDEDDEAKVVSSIQRSLVCLGDLARYREKHTRKHKSGQKQDFQLCQNYYNIARLVDPASGNPHNQLAVIATYRGDSFSAVYQYYRAISVKKGFPTAQENLAVIFSKAFSDDGLQAKPSDSARFRSLVVRLHAILFLRQSTKNYDGLERQVLSSFAMLIGQRGLSSEHITQVLTISIAALQHIRLYRPSSDQPKFLPDAEMKINVESRALYLVLQIIERLFKAVGLELKAANLDVIEKSADQKALAQSISPVVRRLLPALRIASAWLKINVNYIERAKPDGSHNTLSIWTSYGNFATSLVKAYPRKLCPPLDQPLEEDIDMRNFAPLKRTMLSATLAQSIANICASTQKHPNDEHFMRIGDLEKDVALHLQAEGGPIMFKDNVFVPRRFVVNPGRTASPTKIIAIDSTAEHLRANPIVAHDERHVKGPAPVQAKGGATASETSTRALTSGSPSFSLEGMVADLIDDEGKKDSDESEEMLPQTEKELLGRNDENDDIVFPLMLGNENSRDSDVNHTMGKSIASPIGTPAASSAKPAGGNAQDLLLQVLNSSSSQRAAVKESAGSPFAWPALTTLSPAAQPSPGWDHAAFANGSKFSAPRSPPFQKTDETAKARAFH